VSADEAGMRVDRFLEARFPGLSFSHIQRIIRKGELRVNGKRAKPKDRLQAGQAVRIPPLKLDQPRPLSPEGEAAAKTRDFLKSITLYEDDDVLVLNKPMGLAVQGGSGTTRHLDGLLEVLRDAQGQRPRLVHRLDKDTAGCLLVAKTRFAASALAKTFRSRRGKSTGRWSRACPSRARGASRPFSPRRSARMTRSCGLRVMARKGRATR
jgi:23S rRNA pseudouridine955/2504/2580 synthase